MGIEALEERYDLGTADRQTTVHRLEPDLT